MRRTLGVPFPEIVLDIRSEPSEESEDEKLYRGNSVDWTF